MLTETGRDCPEGPKDTKTCYRCGTAGHISRDCPQSGPVGGAGGGSSGAECYKVSQSIHSTSLFVVRLTYALSSAVRSATLPATAPRAVTPTVDVVVVSLAATSLVATAVAAVSNRTRPATLAAVSVTCPVSTSLLPHNGRVF